MLPEFPRAPRQFRRTQAPSMPTLDAGNLSPAATTHTRNVKICNILQPSIFFSHLRYLFSWYGFDATEFTCANLELTIG
jgi:hypothetical protein